MSKWIWRFLAGRDLLWVRVIKSCQGDFLWGPEGFVRVGRKSYGVGWWKRIVSLGNGGAGKWLRDNLLLKVGEGSEVSFWHHWWVGSTPLKSLFPRLYHISDNQERSVRSMGEWVNGIWGWNLGWRRVLFDRDVESVDQLMLLINNVRLMAGSKDKWAWKDSNNGKFSVQSAYHILSSERGGNPTNALLKSPFSSLWKAPRTIQGNHNGMESDQEQDSYM